MKQPTQANVIATVKPDMPMPLCSKCRQNEATFHGTSIINGVPATLDLCQDCAQGSGFEGLNPPRTLCSKCRQNEAIFHSGHESNGVKEEMHLCQDCYSAYVARLTLEDFETFSLVGKKCALCGRDADAGLPGSENTAIYWCRDCAREWSPIFESLLASEHPDWLQQIKERRSFLSRCYDPEYWAWSKAAIRKAIRLLKDCRIQDGRDKGG